MRPGAKASFFKAFAALAGAHVAAPVWSCVDRCEIAPQLAPLKAMNALLQGRSKHIMTGLPCAPRQRERERGGEKKKTRARDVLPAMHRLLYFPGNKSVVHDQRSMAARSLFALALKPSFEGKDAVSFLFSPTVMYDISGMWRSYNYI